MDSARNRTRVLLCIKCLGYGGAERLLVSAAGLRDRSRFEYEVAYVLPSKDALVPEVEATGVPVHCLGDSDSNLDLRWALRLRRLLLERHFDVVHLHLPYTAAVGRLVVASLPPQARPATVTTDHNSWGTNPLPLRLLDSLTRPSDAAGIAVSATVRDALPARHRGNVEVVVHGPAPARPSERQLWRAESRASLGVAAGEVLIGTVANLRPGKGYDVLLPAARLLIDRGLPVRFAAVGSGPLDAEVAQLHRRLGLGDRFALLGGRADAMQVLAGFDVFALPSSSEGLPVAVMEALALGVPVVASSVGGIPDLVEHGRQGLLVRPGSVESLVEALERLVVDRLGRARMAAAALSRGARLDITGAVRRIEAVYALSAGPVGLPAEIDLDRRTMGLPARWVPGPRSTVAAGTELAP